MKEKYIIVLFVLIFAKALSGSSSAQSSWERTSNFPGGQQKVFSLTVSQTGALISESRGAGIFRSSNNGANWSLVSSVEKQIASLTTAPDGKIYALYITSTSLNISRSTDDGLSWSNVYTHPTISGNFYVTGGIAFLPNGNIAASMERLIGPLVSNSASMVVRSSNGGSSWSKVWDDSAHGNGSLNNLKYFDGLIYASYHTGGGSVCPVVISIDEGSSWTQVTGSLLAFGNSLAVDVNFQPDGIIYSGIWTGDNVTDKLLISTNKGSSWSSNLPGGNVFTLFTASNGDLYAASDYSLSPWTPKIRRSTDHGQTWTLLIDGIPTGVKTYAFAENSAGDIFAGSTVSLNNDPGGVFILRNALGIKQIGGNIPSGFLLHQNYPNPFNPECKIKFDIPAFTGSLNNNVTLVVYDMLGRVVDIPVNSRLNPGSYELKWNGSRYPCGAYFYRLTAGSFTETKKMIMVK